jgi:hypothetical protein
VGSMKKPTFKIPDSIPIQNDKDILMWVCRKELEYYQAQQKVLLSSHVEDFTIAFGPHHSILDGEYKKRVWKIKILTINLLTQFFV